MSETAKVNSNGIDYEFKLLDALHGIGLYHHQIKDWRDKIKDIDSAIAVISGLELQDLYELSGMMLNCAKIGDETCDEMGMCKTFARKPHAFYEALILALAANYSDYFPFLLGGDDITEPRSQK